MNLSAKNCPKIKAENHLLQKDCNLGKLLIEVGEIIYFCYLRKRLSR